MGNWHDSITQLGHAVISKTRLSNAMGAPLVHVVIIATPCFILFGITNFWPVLILPLMTVGHFLYSFDYLMKNNPNMLRTEEHEEKMMQLSVGLGESGKKELPESKVIDMVSTTNPTARAINRGNK